MFGFCAGLAIHSLLQAIVSAIHSSTHPRRWRRWKWSYTPPSPSPSASSPFLLSFYASLDASLDANGGVTPKARAERCDRVRTFSRPPTAGWLSAICELMCNVHKARMSWAPNPINYILIALLCIDSPISCNIYVFEVYNGTWATPSSFRAATFP